MLVWGVSYIAIHVCYLLNELIVVMLSFVCTQVHVHVLHTGLHVHVFVCTCVCFGGIEGGWIDVCNVTNSHACYSLLYMYHTITFEHVMLP